MNGSSAEGNEDKENHSFQKPTENVSHFSGKKLSSSAQDGSIAQGGSIEVKSDPSTQYQFFLINFSGFWVSPWIIKFA